MDPDRIKGKMKQVEGKLIDAKGDLTGNLKDDIRGKVRKAEGAAQEAWGKAKDTARKRAEKP